MTSTATPAFASAFVELTLESRFSFSSGALPFPFPFGSVGSFPTGDVWHLELLRVRRNRKPGTEGQNCSRDTHCRLGRCQGCILSSSNISCNNRPCRKPINRNMLPRFFPRRCQAKPASPFTWQATMRRHGALLQLLVLVQLSCCFPGA